MTPLPDHPPLRLPAACHSSALWLALLPALSILACDETATTETRAVSAPTEVSASTGEGDALAQRDVSALAISLPVNQSIATTAPAPAFRITQTGTGPNGGFVINRATNGQPALTASTNGTGGAGIFRITNQTSAANALLAMNNGTRAAVRAQSTGTGQAGLFEINNATSAATVLYAQTAGLGGAGLFQVNNRSNAEPALVVEHIGTGPALSAASGSGSAGVFSAGGSSGSPALEVRSSRTNVASNAFQTRQMGSGNAAVVEIFNTGNVEPALRAVTNGPGYAGRFTGTMRGVLITTNDGGIGLVVAGGSKNAIVSTTAGARALYSEEATEVWFADYGFGKLENGRARILIDPSFAQTVSLDEPYHVFLQPYGRAELYIEERTNLGFVVMLKDGEPNVEFGYRVVAKRSGFETKRLERAPWADNSSTFTEQR
jgi:hypothetical protein